MTTAMCFDLDGTLVRYSSPFGELVESALATHLDDVTAETVDRYVGGFHDAFDALEPDPIRRGMAAAIEPLETDVDPSTLADELRRREVVATELAPGAGELVETLAGDPELLLGVVTNGLPDLQREKLDAVGLTAAFDAVAVSYEVGAHKPDQALFETIRDRLDADRYVMVGDDLEKDVRPAVEIGFEGIHVDDEIEVATVGGVDAIGLLRDAFR